MRAQQPIECMIDVSKGMLTNTWCPTIELSNPSKHSDAHELATKATGEVRIFTPTKYQITNTLEIINLLFI